MAEQLTTGGGLRYNDDKIRFDLLEPFAIEQLAKVFSRGAKKYSDHNWLGGMKWSKMMASMKRHLSEFEKGNDYDFDENCDGCKAGNCTSHTGLLHMAHAAWNCMALLSYYKHFPQGDDRLHTFLPKPKIGLDIDEVLADWVGHWIKYFPQDRPEFWNFDHDIKDKFEQLKDNKQFWLSIPAKINPSELGFEPTCYITSRNIPIEWTKEWLQNNKFASVPVYSIGHGISKIETAKNSGIDWFIDDRYDNFVELNKNGVFTFLMDAPHNRRYNVGHKRILNFKDFKERFL